MGMALLFQGTTTANEAGQKAYEAYQNEARIGKPNWHYIPWHHLSTIDQLAWVAAAFAVRKVLADELRHAEGLDIDA